MNVAVIANETLKRELLSKGTMGELEPSWHAELQGIDDADSVIDLLFQPGPDRIAALEKTGARFIAVNFITGTLQDLPDHFIRFNGWPGFLKGPLVEAAAKKDDIKKQAEDVFSFFNKKISWVTDQPGFISARIIAMIINEAYLACGEGVSSKEEIDTAMKLGTHYPYGPFEWSRLIGISHIHQLLVDLSAKHPRYQPAPLLAKESFS